MATSTLTSIGSTTSNVSSTAAGLAVTGLASGMNWATIVQELGQAERSPELQWQAQQSTMATQNAAYATMTSDLTTLQTDAQNLLDPSFFNSVVAASSATTVAAASVASGTPTGNYIFNIKQLATAAQMNGANNVSQALVPGGDPSTVTVGAAGFATPVTAGAFTVNGVRINIATTDSLQSVFNNIASATNAAGNQVTASYDVSTDKITLTSGNGSAITLGSATDTSNFLQEAQLYNNSGTVTSAAGVGNVNPAVPATAAGFSTPVTTGTFTVNGAPVTIAPTDTLQNIFANIATATGNKVTGSYDDTTDTITLASSDGSPITLGSGTDTSNFLAAAQLSSNPGSITSGAALGHVNPAATLNAADLKTTITNGAGSGNGSFTINGVSFSYNATTDGLQDIMANINESGAGVTASYDPINNRFVLANTSTGDVGISMQDVKGNFLAATGLSGGALSHGKNLLYSLNGGSQQIVSQSNTIDPTSSGITGLTVTAMSTGATTVNVSTDTTTIGTAIQKFVTDYSAAQTYITGQQAVTTAADGSVTPGTLTGDSTTNDIATNLRSLAGLVENITGTSGAVSSLTDLGFQSNGNNNTIAMSDSSTLTAMLTSHLKDVAALFSDPTKGLATQMNSYITNTIGANGSLPTRTSDLTQQSTDITTQISNLETKISNDSNQWNSEFQAMETAESQTNQELTYLSQGVTNGSL